MEAEGKRSALLTISAVTREDDIGFSRYVIYDYVHLTVLEIHFMWCGCKRTITM
jgi:hypothetical protein